VKTAFIALSAVFLLASAVPYLLDIVKGTTKPRLVSWFNWGLLTGIATAAAFADRQYPSAVLTLAAFIQVGFIVFLGWRKGDRKLEPLDIYCQIAAIVGLVLWFAFNSPLVAIVATTAIDFIVGLPTVKHAWDEPDEETLSTFVLVGIGGIFSVLALDNPHASGLVYPIFVVAIAFTYAAEIFVRRRMRVPAAEVRLGEE
jgi:hypothetical protein